MSNYPTFHRVPLPAERDAALRYFDTYVALVNHHRRLDPDGGLFPYTRQDYIKEITAFFGERKDPLPKVGPKVGTLDRRPTVCPVRCAYYQTYAMCKHVRVS